MEAKVSSVGKALSILDCFSISRPELSLAQISAESAYRRAPPSTRYARLRTGVSCTASPIPPITVSAIR